MAKIIDNYILLEHICQGTFGEIHKGRNLISKEAVAVKTVQLEQFLNDSVLRDMIINEIQALKKLEDPNIVRMIKMLKSSNNIYLIYEFLSGRNLKKLLNERHHLSELESIQIFQQICKGFQRLQSEKIIKKNLNSSNVHILEPSGENSSTSANYEVKLKHFFICKSSSSNSSSSKKFEQFLFEKFHYVAPELLMNSQQNNNVQGNNAKSGSNNNNNGSFEQESSCDVFSAGIILYEMILGCLPFVKYANRKEDLIEFYTNNDIKEVIRQDINHLSERTQHLLNRMIVVKLEDRITWEQIFELINSQDFKSKNFIDSNQNQQQNLSPRKLSSVSNNVVDNNNSGLRGNDFDAYQQIKGAIKSSKSDQGSNIPYQKQLNSNNNQVSDDEDNENDESKSSKKKNEQSANQKSNKKSKSNVNVSNNIQNQIGSVTSNFNTNTSSQKQKYRNNSEITQQANIQDGQGSPPTTTVNLTYNKSQQNIYNQKDQNTINQYNTSTNSKINKENAQVKINQYSGNILSNKRENSVDHPINAFQLNNNFNGSGSKKSKEAINLILDEVMDKRSKIQVALGALDNCMDQDEWNAISLNVYSCGFILLKKACGLSEHLIRIFEQPETVLGHLNLNSSQIQAWQFSQKKQQIKLNIMRENIELKNNLMKFQDDFSESIEIKVNNTNIYNSKRGDDIENDEILNSLLFEASKEMSQISFQTKNRKCLVLAHYLADIACIDIMYNKFLGKKRLDVLNHPYFKKLSEISREKLQENLDNKFKLYEYHRSCSEN